MSILEHFKNQPIHSREGKDSWYVITDKEGPLEVRAVPVCEIETYLEGTLFQHMAGDIPRFNRPLTHGKWKNPLTKPNGNT